MVSPWKILESRYVLKERWITLRADKCETAKGIIVDPYYVQESPDWVHVVAFDTEFRILLIKQYRHASGVVSLELPGGCVDKGESPEGAALRELREETGYVVEGVQALPAAPPNPARDANKMYAFLGLNARLVHETACEPAEEIEVHFLPIPEVLDLIESGNFQHPLHAFSIYTALRKLNLLKEVSYAAL